jgi:hypothetical protein
MAKSATQLSVAKNEDVAETVAATIWDLITAAVPATARDASAFRMVRKHVKEMLELHDGLSADEVLAAPQPSGNGQPRQLVDLGGNAREG